MSAESATALLNDYYDCIVPAVEANGGEVLKFIGDGILAIFRTNDRGTEACERSLYAAQAGLRAVAAQSGKKPRFEVGIALHFGEVAYGNVGSGVRLDYTVIGRDVNFASRIAGQCREVDRHVLVSSAFCKLLPNIDFTECGTHQLKGLKDPETLFSPS